MFSKGSSDRPEEPQPASIKPKAAKSGMPSIVSPGLQITGNMVSDGDMQIEGSIEGDVKSRVLTVGESGSINGQVEADQAFISGTVTGKIHARSVNLAKSARVNGDIAHEMIAIEAGAMVEGTLKYLGKSKSGADDTFESVKKQIKDVAPSSGSSGGSSTGTSSTGSSSTGSSSSGGSSPGSSSTGAPASGSDVKSTADQKA